MFESLMYLHIHLGVQTNKFNLERLHSVYKSKWGNCIIILSQSFHYYFIKIFDSKDLGRKHILKKPSITRSHS